MSPMRTGFHARLRPYDQPMPVTLQAAGEGRLWTLRSWTLRHSHSNGGSWRCGGQDRSVYQMPDMPDVRVAGQFAQPGTSDYRAGRGWSGGACKRALLRLTPPLPCAVDRG